MERCPCLKKGLCSAYQQQGNKALRFPRFKPKPDIRISWQLFCNGHLQHSRPRINRASRNVAKLTVSETPARGLHGQFVLASDTRFS